MTSPVRSASRGLKLCLAGSLLLGASVQPAFAAYIDPSIVFPVELLSFGGGSGLTGSGYLPLTSASYSSTMAGAPAPTADNYGWTFSDININLSTTTPSVGQASMSLPYDFGPAGVGTAAVGQRCIEGGMAGDANTGDTVCVNSFFDVFFDVTITAADTTNAGFFDDTATVLSVTGLGPASMELQGQECIWDDSLPNGGCLPPTGDAYIGHFDVVIDLMMDVNGMGGNDVLKFTLATHNVGDVSQTWIDGLTLYDEFDTVLDLEGGVEDDATDPPFLITVTGPTTASQGIVYNAPTGAPEPASIALLAGGIGLLGFRRRRK